MIFAAEYKVFNVGIKETLKGLRYVSNTTNMIKFLTLTFNVILSLSPNNYFSFIFQYRFPINKYTYVLCCNFVSLLVFDSMLLFLFHHILR